jgi:hypothetical protein
MMSIGLLLLSGVAHSVEDSWPYTWPVMLLGLLWAPGLGWARWLSTRKPVGRLQLGIDAAWIGMGTASPCCSQSSRSVCGGPTT